MKNGDNTKSRKPLKVICVIISVLLFAVIVLCCILELYPMLHDRTEYDGTLESASRWMADIDDDKLLSDISIPGVHDAAADECQLRLLAKCQDKEIRKLLEDGYRYLDIRLGIEKIDGKDNLTFYHGFLHCLNGKFPWSGHLTFEDVIQECGEFLKENPTETILFVVKQEHGSEDIIEFAGLLNTMIENSETRGQWLLTDRIPTLGEARGKIVLFRRYEDHALLGEKSGIYIDWGKQDNKPEGEQSKSFAKEQKETFNLMIQDRYKYDAETKWKVFLDTVNVGNNEKAAEDVMINFLSSNGTMAYGHPYALAEKLNKRLLDLGKDTVLPGWTILDFCDARLADVIIRSNEK